MGARGAALSKGVVHVGALHKPGARHHVARDMHASFEKPATQPLERVMTLLIRASTLLGAMLFSLVPATVALAAAMPETATEAIADAANSLEVTSRAGVAEKSYSVAGALSIVGSTTYSISNSARTVNMTAEKIRNDSATWLSGTLRLRLFVTTAPISGAFTYWTVGELALDQLQPLYAYNNLNQTVSLSSPPDGVYYVHLGIFEYEASCTSASGYCVDDYVSFSTRVQVVNGNFSAYAPPVLPPLTIQNGVWWSPTESGSGYAVHVSNGVLVMQIYSYRADGEPQWYLTAGPLGNGNRNYTGTLDKYRGGQCIYCGYQGPTPVGNDGAISIQFITGSSATVKLPGGRTTNIELFLF